MCLCTCPVSAGSAWPCCWAPASIPAGCSWRGAGEASGVQSLRVFMCMVASHNEWLESFTEPDCVQAVQAALRCLSVAVPIHTYLFCSIKCGCISEVDLATAERMMLHSCASAYSHVELVAGAAGGERGFRRLSSGCELGTCLEFAGFQGSCGSGGGGSSRAQVWPSADKQPMR